MPLLSHYNPEAGLNVFIWKMSESLEELLELDPAISVSEQNIHPKRKKELLVTKHILKTIGFKSVISYLDNGKPVLDDGRHISISHCGDLGGFAISDKAIGLDIQDDNPKLATIASRYCHPEELEWARSQFHPLACFTILWACKEAVFKIFGENVVFAEQIRVEPFHTENQLPLHAKCMRANQWYSMKVYRIRLGEYWILMASPQNSGT